MMPPVWRCCWNWYEEWRRKSRSNICGGKKGESNAGKVCEPLYTTFIAKSLHNDGKHLRFGISEGMSFIIYFYWRVFSWGIQIKGGISLQTKNMLRKSRSDILFPWNLQLDYGMFITFFTKRIKGLRSKSFAYY